MLDETDFKKRMVLEIQPQSSSRLSKRSPCDLWHSSVRDDEHMGKFPLGDAAIHCLPVCEVKVTATFDFFFRCQTLAHSSMSQSECFCQTLRVAITKVLQTHWYFAKTRNELRSGHCFKKGLSKRRAFFVFLRSSLTYINVKKHFLKVPKMVLTKWEINNYSCQDCYMK